MQHRQIQGSHATVSSTSPKKAGGFGATPLQVVPVWREKAAWIPPPNGEIPAMPGGQKAHLKRIANPRLPYVVKPGFLGKTHQSHTAQLSNNYHLNSKSSLLKSSLSGAGKEAVILITVLHQFLKGTQIYYIVPSFLASIQDT